MAAARKTIDSCTRASEVAPMRIRRLDSVYSTLLEQSPEAERLRRRVAGTVGVALLAFGLLVALGLWPVILVLLAIAALGAPLGLVVARPQQRRLRHLTRVLERRSRAGRGDAAGWPFPQPLHGAGASIPAPDEEPTVEEATAIERTEATDRRNVAAPRRTLPDGGVDDGDGARCNGFGMRLRRAGEPEQAAVMHRAAGLMFAETGNARGEALALNGLGLALAALGEHEQALDQFARARTLLQSLGDEECEAKVIANIGFAKQKVGEDAEAAELLQAALIKLEPHTRAYRIVEQRLRRAG